MPNNWAHLGFTRLILPRARVIDVRRSPMACGFSNFRQLYASGLEHCYSLEEWGRYYRTYPAYVEDEVKAALGDPARHFERGPISLAKRDTASDASAGFVVVDGNYVSARWPGDAYSFARAFERVLTGDAPRRAV